MKSAVRLAGALLLALGASTVSVRGAYAQQPILKTKIPFDFTVGDTSMPAGEYTITERYSFLLLETAGQTAMVPSIEGRGKSESGSGKLVFHQYGNQYFLDEVCSSPNGHLNREILPSKAEKVARQHIAPNTVALR